MEFFLPLRNECFLIEDEQVKSKAVLTDISPLRAGNPGKDVGGAIRSFSLVFHLQEYLPQKMYRVIHEQSGVMEIFLVPMEPDEQGHRMEAIFSRL